jgi:hypothetical protein
MWAWKKLKPYSTSISREVHGKSGFKSFFVAMARYEMEVGAGIHPTFHILLKGWLCFEFNSSSDLEKILS